MKKISLFLVALAAVCSCSKNEVPVANSAKSFVISANSTVGTESKVSMGAKSDGVYPVSWSNEEHAYLREIAYPSSGEKETVNHYASSSFSKTDAHTASFSFDVAAQTIEGTYDYVSVCPCHPTDPKESLNFGVRYSGTDMKNRASYCLDPKAIQTPLSDAPDPLTHMLMATDLNHSSQAANVHFDYQYVVGFGKMTLKKFPALASGETVSQITISVPTGKYMTGRMYHYFHPTDSHASGDVIPYDASAADQNKVKIDPKNINFNTTGFDVWFTAFPFTLAANDVISLSVETSVKTYTANITLTKDFKIEAGKVSEFVYDYEKGQPQAETKTLTFDFSSSTPLEGWPSADKWDTKPGDKTCIYKLGDVDYEFILTDCQNATNARTFWSTDGRGVVMGAVYRYIGMPVLTGYKLISIACVQGTADSASGRMVGVTNTVAATSSTPHVFVGGGDTIYWTKKGYTYSYSLTNTVKDTMYYLVCTKGGAGATEITLVYEKVEE